MLDKPVNSKPSISTLAHVVGSGPTGAPGLLEERRWRDLGTLVNTPLDRRMLASRWVDGRAFVRRERAVAPVDQYVVSVALRTARLRIIDGACTLSEGSVPVGTVHVTAPGRKLEAEFGGPCDFIHFHVAGEYFDGRRAALASGGDPELHGLQHRDLLAAQLARTLINDVQGGDRPYQESVGSTIVDRVLTARRYSSRISPLPKWRLRRVQEHIASNIGEQITLRDLASAAGLSRMHFAGQFRAATGFRPHEYVLQQRVELAKTMMRDDRLSLVETALNVGFQTQAHFTTVFKRITGETPGRWCRLDRSFDHPGVGLGAHAVHDEGPDSPSI
jgi:AraC family transcriptional regulator